MNKCLLVNNLKDKINLRKIEASFLQHWKMLKSLLVIFAWKSWDFGNLQNASSQLRKLFISSVIFGNVRSNFSVEEQKLTENMHFLQTNQNEEILSSVFYNDILLEKVEFLVWTALREITSCRKFVYLKSFGVINQSQLCQRISNSTVCLFSIILTVCLVFLNSYFEFLRWIACKLKSYVSKICWHLSHLVIDIGY